MITGKIFKAGKTISVRAQDSDLKLH